MFQRDRQESDQLSKFSFHTHVPLTDSFSEDIEQRFPWITDDNALTEALGAPNWPSEQQALFEQLHQRSHESIEGGLQALSRTLLPLIISPEGTHREESLPIDAQERFSRNKFAVLQQTLALANAQGYALPLKAGEQIALTECLLHRFERHQGLYLDAEQARSLTVALADGQLVREYLAACATNLYTLPDAYARHFGSAVDRHLHSFLRSIRNAEDGVFMLNDHHASLSLLEEVGHCATLLSPHVDPYLLAQAARLLHEMYELHSTTSYPAAYTEEDELSDDEFWSAYGAQKSPATPSPSVEGVEAYFSQVGERIIAEEEQLTQSKALVHTYLAVADALQEAPCTEDAIEHWEQLCNEGTPASPHFYQGFYGLHAISAQRTFPYLDSLIDAMGENVDGQAFYATFTVLGTAAGEDALVEALSKRSLDDQDYVLEQLFAVLDGFHPLCNYYHSDSLASLERVTERLRK